MGSDSVLSKVSQGLAEAVESAAIATVRVDARHRIAASGIVWAADGLILTADHVVEREDDIKVGFADGTERAATLLGRDPGGDLALLRAEGASLAPARLAAEDSLRVGHLVVAIGRPTAAGVEATMGIVSAIGGPWRSRHGGVVEGYLRTDVTMYPGFSGGPLIDASGCVVGLNSSFLGPTASITLPVSAMTRIAEALRLGGRVRRGYLGLRTQRVSLAGAVAVQAGQPTGLLVMGVEPDGPADRSGILLGDILVALAGQPVRDADELQAQLGGDKVGASGTVTVVRGGERRDLIIMVGERR